METIQMKIGNAYGSLEIMELNGKYYWIVSGYPTETENIEEWEEISKTLYDEIILHRFKSPSN